MYFFINLTKIKLSINKNIESTHTTFDPKYKINKILKYIEIKY